MTEAFAAIDARMQSDLESIFGRTATGSDAGTPVIYMPMRARPSARPAPDSGRAVMVLPRAIVSLSFQRVDIGDNGMGRSSGGGNLNIAGHAIEMSFGKTHLNYEPRRFDEVSIDAEQYAVATVMDDGGAGWSLKLNRVN